MLKKNAKNGSKMDKPKRWVKNLMKKKITQWHIWPKVGLKQPSNF